MPYRETEGLLRARGSILLPLGLTHLQPGDHGEVLALDP